MEFDGSEENFRMIESGRARHHYCVEMANLLSQRIWPFPLVEEEVGTKWTGRGSRDLMENASGTTFVGRG